jgi:NADH-quinone oxidoreductase subunit A
MEGIARETIWAPWEPGFLAIILYAFMIFLLVGILLFLAGWLGEKRPVPEKSRPFESGIIPTGSARVLFPISFYLVAAFFLIFDVEGMFIVSWAIAVKALGWHGFLQITFFILILLVSLFYIWKKGGLEWGPARSSRR